MINTNSNEFLAVFESRNREEQIQILDRILPLANVGENAERLQQELAGAKEHEEELKELLSLIREKNKNSEEKCKTLREEILKLEGEVSRLRSAGGGSSDQAWEAERQKLTAERDALQKMVQTLTEEKMSLIVDARRLGEEVYQLRQTQTAPQGWEAEKRQILENFAKLQQQYQALAANSGGQNWAAEKQRLEQECQSWQKKHDAQRFAKEEQTKKAKELEAKITKLMSMQTENERLKKAYDKLEAEKKTLATKLARLEVEKSQSEQEHQQAAVPQVDEKTRRRLEKSTALSDDEMRRRGKNMPSVGGSGTGSKVSPADRVMQQLSALEAENANLKNVQHELETTNSALQRQLESVQIDARMQELEQLKTERQKMDEVRSQLEKQHSQLAQEAGTLRQEAATLRQEAETLRTEKQQYVQVAEALRNESQQFAQEAETLRTEKQQLAGEKDALEAQKKALEEELAAIRQAAAMMAGGLVSEKPQEVSEKKEEAASEEKKEEKPASEEKKEEAASEEKKEEAASEEKKEEKSASEEKKEEKPASEEKKEEPASEEKKEEPASEEKKEEKPASEEKKEETASEEKKEEAASEEKKEEKPASEEKKEEAASEEKKEEAASEEKKEEKPASEEKKEETTQETPALDFVAGVPEAAAAPKKQEPEMEDFQGSLYDLRTATSPKALEKIKVKFLTATLSDDFTIRLFTGVPKKKAHFTLIGDKVYPNPHFFKTFATGGETGTNLQYLDSAFNIMGLDSPTRKYVLGAIEPAKVDKDANPKEGYPILQKGRIKLIPKT